MDIKLFLVGGAIRDELLGLPVKDLDYSVVVNDAIGQPIEVGFAAMREFLESEGFKIFVETPEFLTMRAQWPHSHLNRKHVTADFVLARSEGVYKDGRRPTEVFVGTLEDDLARRDFTVNAMARDGRDITAPLIDPHNGMADIHARRLRFVGDPVERLDEDILRALRAIRFSITKGLQLDLEAVRALESTQIMDRIARSDVNRRRDELALAFAHNTIATIDLMNNIHHRFLTAALTDLRLQPTLKTRGKF